MELVRNVNGKLLRCGYTTGACAAGAAKAAGIMLLGGSAVKQVAIGTPKGIELTLDVVDVRLFDSAASCAVQKNSGDDPDVTDGAYVYARVEKSTQGIHVDGGEGIGRCHAPRP
jgi:cobalt-precorrin-5B (C1)-methyltransferase